MSKSKSNKPAAAPSQKKGTPPTKPLTKAKKAAGSKRHPALNRFTKTARKIARIKDTTDEKKEAAREAAAAMRLRTRMALTADKVTDALQPLVDALDPLLAWPSASRDEDMYEVSMEEPSDLEGLFDRLFDEPPLYILRLKLIRPIASGSISEHLLLECRGTTPLEAGQRFLAEAMMFVRLLLNRARGERNTKSARERLDQNKRLKRAYDQFMRDYATARATLPGSALDKAAGFF